MKIKLMKKNYLNPFLLKIKLIKKLFKFIFIRKFIN